MTSWRPFELPRQLISLLQQLVYHLLICLFGANVLNQRNQASLTAAYVMLNESYSRYRGAANTVFGDDADSKIKAEVAKETYISADGCAIYDASHDDGCEECLFYDEISDRYFQSTMASVLNANLI